MNAGGGNEFIGKPADYGRTVRDVYTAKHYHKPSDEVRPDWDLAGAVNDLKLYFAVGYRVAAGRTRGPPGSPGSEFKAQAGQDAWEVAIGPPRCMSTAEGRGLKAEG